MSAVDVAPEGGLPAGEDEFEHSGLWQKARDNVKSGNLGVLPVVIGELAIVVFFGLTATNFFTAANFVNVMLQMAGVTMIAFGVVFVLLLGEIDLSIGYVSGIAALAAAEFQLPSSSHDYAGLDRDPARARDRCRDRHRAGHDGRQGRRAVLRRHARRAPHLAGRDPEGARAARGDHHRGQLDQLRSHLLLLAPDELADRGDHHGGVRTDRARGGHRQPEGRPRHEPMVAGWRR